MQTCRNFDAVSICGLLEGETEDDSLREFSVEDDFGDSFFDLVFLVEENSNKRVHRNILVVSLEE